MNARWVDEVYAALSGLGGVASLGEIYEAVERARAELPDSWRAIIRKTIESHSSDSKIFNNRSEDLFFSVYGKGDGVWGIRGGISLTEVARDSNMEEEDTVRFLTSTYRILRDTELARGLKSLYGHQCQLCNLVLLVGEVGYSEAHHIKPLGKPHSGPDLASNIIVLCPNCHVLCDYGARMIERTELTCCEGHDVADKFLDYHNTHIYRQKPACFQ